MKKPKPIEILTDGYQIYGPKVDGSFTVKFGFGEYQRDKVRDLMKLEPNQKIALYIMPMGDEDGGQ